MPNPIKQHFIPKSYLKNFSIQKGKGKKLNYFVDIYLKDPGVTRSGIPTKTICYEKNLYTMDFVDESKKFDLEIYYANNVDSEFPKIYNLLIDKNKRQLTQDEKIKVLYVCLSLYFRTPVHLNNQNAFSDQLIDRFKMYADEKGIVKTAMFNDKGYLHIDELEQIRKKTKNDAKTKFQIEHIRKWFDFVQHKYECTINVIEIKANEGDLITCDNPVTIREWKTNKFRGLFNLNNVISMPLDTKHFLEIHPNTMAENEMKIHRLVHDKDYVFTSNAMIEKNADNVLIGKKGTIDKHFEMVEYYKTNGNKFIEKQKFKAHSMQKVLSIAQKFGFNSEEFNEYIKTLSKHEDFKNDSQIQSIVKMLKEAGIHK